MRRRRIDVDWYVEYSERLERREARRKWVVLGACVAVSLLLILMGSALLYVRANHPRAFSRVVGFFGLSGSSSASPDAAGKTKSRPVAVGPVIVAKFEQGDLKYPQLDGNGFPTSITHYFREFPYEFPADVEGDPTQRGYRVARTSSREGTIEEYRLRNIGTGDQFEFRSVAVERNVADDWLVTEKGHREIKKSLEAKLKVSLSKAIR